MRVVLKPLVAQVPIIGAVTVFFLDKPVHTLYYLTNMNFLPYDIVQAKCY